MAPVQRYQVMANVAGLRVSGGPCEADPDDPTVQRYVAKGWLVPIGPDLEDAFPVDEPDTESTYAGTNAEPLKVVRASGVDMPPLAEPVHQAVPAEEPGSPWGVAEPIDAPIGDWGLEEDDD